MTQTELILLNFEEIRRRSIKLWTGLPPEHYSWRPDDKAMGCLELVRHVLEAEHLFNKIVDNRGDIGDYISPWENRPYTSVEDELDFAKPYRAQLMETIKNFTADELTTVEIKRTGKAIRKLGDYLQRMAYHEAVHTGQMLSYFRTIGIDRPVLWD